MKRPPPPRLTRRALPLLSLLACLAAVPQAAPALAQPAPEPAATPAASGTDAKANAAAATPDGDSKAGAAPSTPVAGSKTGATAAAEAVSETTLTPGAGLQENPDAEVLSPQAAQAFVTGAEHELAAASKRDQRANWIYRDLSPRTPKSLPVTKMPPPCGWPRVMPKGRAASMVCNSTPNCAASSICSSAAAICPPQDPAQAEESARYSSDGDYGRGKSARPRTMPADLDDLETVMAESHDPANCSRLGRLAPVRALSAPLCALRRPRQPGCHEFGYADIGVLWRTGYDMPPDAFAPEIERLWQQLKPLYIRCTPMCGTS